MEGILSFVHKAEVTGPAEVVQHETQAFHFGRRKRGSVDVEDLPGDVGEGFAFAQLAGIILRLDQGDDVEGLERISAGNQRVVQPAGFKRDVGERADGGGSTFGAVLRVRGGTAPGMWTE